VEVESVLAEYPGVATAAVVGLPHHQWGESVHACIVPREGAVVDLDELLNFASTRLAAFKRPRSAEIRSSLPINGSGKVLKRQLRDELAEQRSEATHLA
ncbi:MAG: fatty-acid--CoA ligase, partial [Armatimonadetes bacterium]|nr:fatty-acid--CoA ligase [Armatimonadota bacterium]